MILTALRLPLDKALDRLVDASAFRLHQLEVEVGPRDAIGVYAPDSYPSILERASVQLCSVHPPFGPHFVIGRSRAQKIGS